MDFIDQTTTRLEEARIRNFTKWQIIGTYVWPNYYVGPTYETEIIFLKNWITARLDWMDIELYGSPISVVNGNNQFVHSFELSQNYPNPFNPTTKIKYSVPGVGTSFLSASGGMKFVKLIIYDILGNEIATLVNEQKPAGNYEVEFDGSNLSSGIFFYKLTAGDFVLTKKMILLK